MSAHDKFLKGRRSVGEQQHGYEFGVQIQTDPGIPSGSASFSTLNGPPLPEPGDSQAE